MKHSSQEVYAILLRRIVREFYSREAALPSERDIADEFGTSRTVIREILKKLEAEGYIEKVSLRKRRISPDQPTSVFDPASRLVGVIGHNDSAQAAEERLFISQRRLRGMFSRLGEFGLSTLSLSLSWSPAMILDLLANHKICGLIYSNEHCRLSTEMEEFLYRTLNGRLPIATFGDTERPADYRQPGLERCLSDHCAGPKLLLDHLKKLNCRRLLWYYPFLNRPQLVWQAERQAGFEKGAREAGVELIPLPEVFPISNEVETRAQFQRYSRAIADSIGGFFNGGRKADGIVVDSDISVPYFHRALRELGIAPGREIPVAGYDNYYSLCRPFQWEATPPAATVEKDDRQIGRRTAELLVRRIQAADELGDSFQEIVPPHLIVPEE